MEIVDFHSHVLPGIDDGSRNIEETMLLMETEHGQGVGQIVATPHFYAQEDPVEEFLVRRQNALGLVREAAAGREDVPGLFLGAEAYYFPGMGKAEMLPKLCIEGTRAILVEMPFCQWNSSIAGDIENMIEKQGLAVVLAHVERYYGFQKDRAPWDEIMDMPVHIQMNGGCFLDWRRRRIASKLLKEGREILLGSDCHNTKTRPPNLEEARTLILKKFGQNTLDRTDRLSAKLLTGAVNQIT